MTFDPYHQWLGIRDVDCPPNHYRLLGIDLFESDPSVISMAADRQMAHLRTFQQGSHSDDSQRLLNQVAAARVCLLDGSKKPEYDERLRDSLRVSAAGPTTGSPLGRWRGGPRAGRRQYFFGIGLLALILLLALGLLNDRVLRQNGQFRERHAETVEFQGPGDLPPFQKDAEEQHRDEALERARPPAQASADSTTSSDSSPPPSKPDLQVPSVPTTDGGGATSCERGPRLSPPSGSSP